MNLAEIEKRVRAEREPLMSQEQLAKLAGVSRVPISQLERGVLAGGRFSKLMRVLNVLGIDVETKRATGRRETACSSSRFPLCRTLVRIAGIGIEQFVRVLSKKFEIAVEKENGSGER